MNSSTTTAWAQALAAQYNDLREDVIVNSGQYGVTTGSANAYLLSIDAQFTAYTAGDTFKFKTNFANTASCTLNVNSVWAKTMKDVEGNTLATGSIVSGAVLYCVYNGTDVIVIGGLFATATNKWDVEMATDAEVVTWTDQTRYVNPKQVSTVVNGTYTTITQGTSGTGTTNSSSTGILSKSTIWTFKYVTWTNSTARLQYSSDDASFSNLVSFGASNNSQFSTQLSRWFSYRISWDHLWSDSSTNTASIVYTV